MNARTIDGIVHAITYSQSEGRMIDCSLAEDVTNNKRVPGSATVMLVEEPVNCLECIGRGDT